MMRSEELELQFTPNRWSRRYRAEEIFQKHVAFVTKASNFVKRNIPRQLNIPYGPTEKEKLDVFGINLSNDSPILIYVHGAGYWHELGREISSFVANPLYKYKFKVITIGYTLCPQVTIPQIIEQIHRGITKCFEFARTSGSRAIYLCGHSAGAHLIATLFQSFFVSLPTECQELLKGVYLVSGIYDLLPLTSTYINDHLKLDASTARRVSPLYQNFLANKDVNFFIIFGENDTPAFMEQSEAFYRKLRGLGYSTELIFVKEVDHFDIAEHLSEDNYEIVRLITDMEDY